MSRRHQGLLHVQGNGIDGLQGRQWDQSVFHPITTSVGDHPFMRNIVFAKEEIIISGRVQARSRNKNKKSAGLRLKYNKYNLWSIMQKTRKRPLWGI